MQLEAKAFCRIRGNAPNASEAGRAGEGVEKRCLIISSADICLGKCSIKKLTRRGPIGIALIRSGGDCSCVSSRNGAGDGHLQIRAFIKDIHVQHRLGLPLAQQQGDWGCQQGRKALGELREHGQLRFHYIELVPMQQESSSPYKKHASGGSNAIGTRGNPSAAWIGLLAPPSSALYCLATSPPFPGPKRGQGEGSGRGQAAARHEWACFAAQQALLHARAVTEWIRNESMVKSLKPLLPSALLLLRGKAANVVLARACPWINSSASGVARKAKNACCVGLSEPWQFIWGSINTLFGITVPAGVMRQAADHDLCHIQRQSRCRAVAMAEPLARSSAWPALAERRRGTISTLVRWNRGAAVMAVSSPPPAAQPGRVPGARVLD